jgi:hypothetical protein
LQYTFGAFNILVLIKFAGHMGQPACYSINGDGFVVDAPPGANGPTSDDIEDFKLRCPFDYNGFQQVVYMYTAAAGTLGLLCLINIPLAALDEKRRKAKEGKTVSAMMGELGSLR